jgi:hypothetical protein
VAGCHVENHNYIVGGISIAEYWGVSAYWLLTGKEQDPNEDKTPR